MKKGFCFLFFVLLCYKSLSQVVNEKKIIGTWELLEITPKIGPVKNESILVLKKDYSYNHIFNGKLRTGNWSLLSNSELKLENQEGKSISVIVKSVVKDTLIINHRLLIHENMYYKFHKI